MKSIISNDRKCYKCPAINGLHKHHIMKGRRNRDKSEEDGLWVYLCYQHHEGIYGVHGRYGKNMNYELIRLAETKWLEYFQKSKEDFIKRYGKNYLED